MKSFTHSIFNPTRNLPCFPRQKTGAFARLGDPPESTASGGRGSDKVFETIGSGIKQVRIQILAVTCHLPSDLGTLLISSSPGHLSDKLSVMISAWQGCELGSSGFLRGPSYMLDT